MTTTINYRKNKVGRAIFGIFKYFVAISILVFTIFPIIWMAITSVQQRKEVFGTFLPKTLDFSNYPRVWRVMNFPQHFMNSVLVTGATVLIVVVVATLAGYAFARYKFRGRDVIFYIFLGSMMVPPQVILIPMFMFIVDINLINTLPGLIIAYLGRNIPFAMFLMRAFFKTLPSELADAARIDGCSEWQVFWKVYLPLARPGIATITIFQFMNTWNEFMLATTFITDPNKKTLQPSLATAVGQYSTDWTALSAGLLMAILPIVIVYISLQRQFIKGLTAGAIKG
ncbi:MAG: carbohydrate ABC transporter permease [Anaerolineaceae bacterium]|nr:carbohydrate ABC transporter permease [Anaerolineaceae bacterium]